MGNPSRNLHNSLQVHAKLAKLNPRILESLKAFMPKTHIKRDIKKRFNIKEKCIQKLIFIKMILNLHRAQRQCNKLVNSEINQHTSINNKNKIPRKKHVKIKMGGLKLNPETSLPIRYQLYKARCLNHQNISKTPMKENFNLQRKKKKFSKANYHQILLLSNR